MKILLDTEVLILAGVNKLSTKASEIYLDSSNALYFSLASLWEIGIKASLGKLKFHRGISAYFDLLQSEGILPLSIEPNHIEKGTSLPFHHKDPFDRLIIGQALEENMTVLGSDVIFDKYGCKRIW